MRIPSLILVLLTASLTGCAVHPKAALTLQQTATNLDFAISTEHVNGLLGLRIWQADTKELFWDVDLHYYREPHLTYGVVPRDFKTFGGVLSSAEQKFPAGGERPRPLPPSTQFRASILCQYDTMFDAHLCEFYFSFTTDADGRVSSVVPVARILREDLPTTP